MVDKNPKDRINELIIVNYCSPNTFRSITKVILYACKAEVTKGLGDRMMELVSIVLLEVSQE